MICFLIELLVRRIWFGQSKLYFILSWLVMRCKLRPFRDFTQDLVRAAGVEGQRAAQRPIHPYPPWVVEGARTELEMAGLRKSDNSLILQVTARELINNQYNRCICVYTDGSMTTEGVGAAFFVPQLGNVTRKYQLPLVSIFF